MSSTSTACITDDARARLAEDGVIHLPGVLGPQAQALALDAFEWSLAHPGPGAAKLPGREAGTFYQDLANPAALARYRPLVRNAAIADIVSALWGGSPAWFMYEQVFVKTGGATRRTPWHQDTPYLPVRGTEIVVMWISFDPVPAAQALEFVRGSHRGLLYDGSRFDPDDDTEPLYGDGTLPRLPDIEAERDRWPIVSWPTEPGDVVLFHPAILHGGGATSASTSRRTLSLRFFGADALVARRPGSAAVEQSGAAPDPDAHPLTRMRLLPEGAPFRDPAFPQVRP